MALPFVPPRADQWFSVGLASSFVDVTGSTVVPLANCHSEDNFDQAGCKVFLAPNDASEAAEQLSQNPDQQRNASLGKGQQVLVFKYKGKFHAIDNKCPHASFPLSNATPFDIEDFGITLSAGITCPQHGWSFDLFTGTGDRGNYKLRVWETESRPVTNADGKTEDHEVWVRKKQRIG